MRELRGGMSESSGRTRYKIKCSTEKILTILKCRAGRLEWDANGGESETTRGRLNRKPHPTRAGRLHDSRPLILSTRSHGFFQRYVGLCGLGLVTNDIFSCNR